MIGLLNDGGWVMYVILFCSIIALAITFERSYIFFCSWERYKDFIKDLAGFFERNDMKGAVAFTKERKTLIRKVAHTYLANMDRKKENLEELLFQEGNAEIKKMERRLPVLSAVSHLTPLMGLLGTVLGMIKCFQDLFFPDGQPVSIF